MSSPLVKTIMTAGLIFGVSLSASAQDMIDDSLTSLDQTLWWKADGWSNGFPFLNRWEGEAIEHSNNGMTIILSHQPSTESNYAFQSGELRSHNFYGYGCYEVEMKAAAVPGVVSAFFLFAGPYDQPVNGNGMHNEIDIEFLGNNTNAVQFNFWTNDDRYARSHEHLHYLSFDASQEYHRYAIQWTADGIEWYIDGVRVYRVDNLPSDPTPTIDDNRLRIMANLWATDPRISNWAGEFDTSPSNQATAQYKAIRFTPNGQCSTQL